MKRFVCTSSCALSVCIAVLAGCSKAQPPATNNPQAAVSVETVAVVSKKLDAPVSLPAQLLPYETVDVYPKVTGFIDSIKVDRGSRVKKGDLLVRLTAPELVAQRSQAESALRAAESQLASAQAKLVADQGTYLHLASAAKTPGVVAENDLLVANQMAVADKGAVAAAESNANAARDALRSVTQMESYLTIEAPFNGVVTTRNLHPGALVGPASGTGGAVPIVQIVDTDRLRLVVPVPEAQIGTMKEGQGVSFTVAAYPGQAFHAPIARISHDVDVNTRTMPVELDVHNQDGRLSPGSFANVTWPVQRAYPTLFVPTTAVTNDQQHSFVIRVRNRNAEWVTVQTGQAVNTDVEVFGGLQAGDQVVRTASDSIRNGQEVSTKAAKQ
ncbi:MAG TPA: efflux RND transporter periplasmic adaptor subunit [Terracidiphilus sp.]|nr:efflux RND transporter periplasmic adaptor subunit [Terracidiphilus sp.]